jgi:hypothetical protein
MPAALPERERHPRVNPSLMALVRTGNGLPTITKLRDLSVTGCCLEGFRETPEAHLFVELPLGNSAVVAHSRVTRVERRSDGLVNLGLAFQDLDWESICAIARHLAPRL